MQEAFVCKRKWYITIWKSLWRAEKVSRDNRAEIQAHTFLGPCLYTISRRCQFANTESYTMAYHFVFSLCRTVHQCMLHALWNHSTCEVSRLSPGFILCLGCTKRMSWWLPLKSYLLFCIKHFLRGWIDGSAFMSAALAEDLSQVPSTHIGWWLTTACNLSSRGISYPWASLPTWHTFTQTHMHTQTKSTHYKLKDVLKAKCYVSKTLRAVSLGEKFWRKKLSWVVEEPMCWHFL